MDNMLAPLIDMAVKNAVGAKKPAAAPKPAAVKA
jgi:hypothetical protein